MAVRNQASGGLLSSFNSAGCSRSLSIRVSSRWFKAGSPAASPAAYALNVTMAPAERDRSRLLGNFTRRRRYRFVIEIEPLGCPRGPSLPSASSSRRIRAGCSAGEVGTTLHFVGGGSGTRSAHRSLRAPAAPRHDRPLQLQGGGATLNLNRRPRPSAQQLWLTLPSDRYHARHRQPASDTITANDLNDVLRALLTAAVRSTCRALHPRSSPVVYLDFSPRSSTHPSRSRHSTPEASTPWPPGTRSSQPAEIYATFNTLISSP